MKSQKESRIDAMVVIHELRYDIARFMSGHCESVDRLIKACEENAWNDCVAYDLKDGMAKLGIVLAALTLWDGEIKLTKEERDAVEKRIEEHEGR